MPFASDAQRKWFFANNGSFGGSDGMTNGEARSMGFPVVMPSLSDGERAAMAAYVGGMDAQSAQSLGESIDRAAADKLEADYHAMWAEQEAQSMDELAALHGHGDSSSREG
jgi:hypothetical protein